MQPSNKEICKAFSNGNFEYTYNFLTDDIEWDIVGDKIVKGKPAVVEFCNSFHHIYHQQCNCLQ